VFVLVMIINQEIGLLQGQEEGDRTIYVVPGPATSPATRATARAGRGRPYNDRKQGDRKGTPPIPFR